MCQATCDAVIVAAISGLRGVLKSNVRNGDEGLAPSSTQLLGRSLAAKPSPRYGDHAYYRLLLRHPDAPPDEVISSLNDELPGVAVALEPDQSALLFIQDEGRPPLLDVKVAAAVRRVCGDAHWGKHFTLPT